MSVTPTRRPGRGIAQLDHGPTTDPIGAIAPTSNIGGRQRFLELPRVVPALSSRGEPGRYQREELTVTERIARIASVLTFAVLMAIGAGPASQAQFADVQDQQAAAPTDAAGDEAAATTLSADELRALVAPVALYPDELLAIVLPAATNPLQVVEASRFLEQQKSDSSLQPDQNWDPAIIALLNYPQVIKQMNDDLGWTQDLGNAVMDQQEDVLNAIQTARSEASEAGYLQSNDQQHVTVTDNDNITIESAQPDTVYVPTYDPQTVVTNNYVGYPPPVYSDPYPAYYAPVAPFFAGAIVGATFAYAFDWDNDDIDIDCCDGGDIDIDNDINIDRGDINIGSGNTDIDKSKIQNRFNGDHAKAGADGKMKWSPQKARQKSTAARKPAGSKPTSANISKQLKNPKPAAARVQSGKTAQKQGQRGQGSIAAASKKNPDFKKQSLQKQQLKQRPAQQRQTQQRPNKQLQQKQLKQKQGGAFNQQKLPKKQVKAQSNRGHKSMAGGSKPRPKRR